MNKPKAILFDIDGTISDSERCGDMSEAIARGDWTWFEPLARNAKPIPPILRAAQETYEDPYTVCLFLTVRQESFRLVTEDWFQVYGMDIRGPLCLTMRPSEQNGWPDHAVKLDAFMELSKKYEIVAAYDDKPEICRMWETLGIPTVVQVTHQKDS